MFYYFDEENYCYKICNFEDISDNSKKIEDEEGKGKLDQKYDFENNCWLDEFKGEVATFEINNVEDNFILEKLNKIHSEIQSIKTLLER